MAGRAPRGAPTGLPALLAAVLLAPLAAPAAAAADAAPAAVILRAADAGPRERLAAREIRRYVFVRTGEFLPIRTEPPERGEAVIVACKDRRPAALKPPPQLEREIATLAPQEYILRTSTAGDRGRLWVCGGDGAGTLYGAYRLAEHFGVRFFLHGDVVDERRMAWKLPDLDERAKPIFELRGLNPWGSHPFGLDLWSTDDWKSHIHQMAKMRMNFVGAHCYPEGHPFAEPTVWVGLPGDFDRRGRVASAYPASYYNAAFSPPWGGLRPGATGAYHLGAAQMFDRDRWGADVMRGRSPRPASPKDCIGLFNGTAAMFREAFTLARQLGVKTCLGTETPLSLPLALRKRLQALGKDPADHAVVEEVYEGMFRRILAAHPLDAYWLWTPEDWTWRGNNPAQLQATVSDVKLAAAALRKLGDPLQLATCGWVLGPAGDRAALDRLLPSRIALSSISRHLGEDPVDPAYGRIRRRDKWAIPWLEGDNGGLAVPQLWVGRIRRDAADARRYGCTGLLGLLWRTRILGPNIAALARAGWEPPREETGSAPQGVSPRMRKAPCEDFYADWASALFGPRAGARIAPILARVDSRLPRPLSRGCPAGVRPDRRPWSQAAPAYAFVKELEACRGQVAGAGRKERFEYWLNTFKYLRAGARLDCAVGKLLQALEAARAEKSPGTGKEHALDAALSAYREVLAAYRDAFGLLLATVSTRGGLATVMFWEHGFFPVAIEKPGRELERMTGRPLPRELRLEHDYGGTPRLIVPTVRTGIAPGETLRLEVIVLAREKQVEQVEGELHWRPMGRGAYRIARLEPRARGVHAAVFPPGGARDDLEYYIEARVEGRTLRFPPAAPALNQTLVLLPGPEENPLRKTKR